ncbi:Thaumatin-like protein [Vitis vinifera]|uniref:Thaumatin-like protein n=1 Tax=Vitis vinifera TaxID=29760 RepID=A0A438BZM5_VITVI|nr:Thaumatin-like protein [Vitis vinifera]
MGLCKILSISSFLLTTLFFTSSYAATFNIQNHCSYTVWAAAVPGGGMQLGSGQSWSLNVNAGTTGGRVWARTNCNFDASGNGKCETGTVVASSNARPMLHRRHRGRVPAALKTTGGCNNPCTVFKTDEYCCNSGSCNATTYSEFFKTRCPDAYSYPKDDQTSTFTCPSGTNYEVIFCP